MSAGKHISFDDLILIALQSLPEGELPDSLAHLSHCEDCRKELGNIQGDLALYALSAEPHSPPAYARERLLENLEKEKKVLNIRSGVLAAVRESSSAGDSQVHPARRRSGFVTWAGWAVAAGLAVFAVLQVSGRRQAESDLQAQQAQLDRAMRAEGVLKTLTDSRAKQVGIHLASAVVAPQGKAPEAHAAYMAESGSLVFFASNLAPLQPYKTYELWLLPANGRDPIAAGLFKPDHSGNANVVLPNLPKGVPAAGFGVTIEDEAGAKQPTLPIIMKGT